MNKKQLKITKIISVTTFLVFPLLIVQMSLAQSPTRGTIKELKKELIQEKKEIGKEKTQNILERVKEVVKEKIKKHIKGKLITIAGVTLTVRQGNVDLTINTSDKTEFKRRFGAVSSLSEFSPNDELIIIGNRTKKSDGTISTTEIDATYIRNMSIQRRFVVFNGEVTAITSTSFILKTKARGTQTVYFSSKTQYKEKNTSISLKDILVGDTIIVKGELWDRVNDKIDAKTILKLNKKLVTVTPPVPTVQKAD